MFILICTFSWDDVDLYKTLWSVNYNHKKAIPMLKKMLEWKNDKIAHTLTPSGANFLVILF